MNDLQKILDEYIQDQNNWELNLRLAECYVSLGQLSAAFTYYMKAVELVDESKYLIRFHCLMMISWIYKTEGCRWLGAIQYARFAKAECPDRPEVYEQLCEILISKFEYEGLREQGEWIQVYENARIGLMYANVRDSNLSLYYKGKQYLECYYALSLLKLGKFIDLKSYLNETKFDTNNIDIMNIILYIYNELRIRNPYITYDQSKLESVITKFDGIEKIEKNYSQSMQDMFVLTALNGETKGTYLEIGSADPEYGSNTKLLEELGWDGLSMDIMINFVYDFNQRRKNTCYCMDALNTDYRKVLSDKFGDLKVIDYLSLDIDPAQNTLECLYRLPLDEFEFKTITFEHDSYQAGTSVRDDQRRYLSGLGYVLVGEDIKCNCKDSFEDWWVNSKYISEDIIENLKSQFSKSNGIVLNAFYSHDYRVLD